VTTTTTSTAPSPATTSPRRSLRRDTPTALLMLAPALIGLIAFVVVPFVTAGWLSLHNIRLNSGRPAVWFGLEQYSRVLSDPEFYRSLLNNFIFAAVVVPLQTALALGMAMLCNRKLRGMSIFRTCFFMPVVFPMALVAVIWKLIYARGDLGMLNAFLSGISFGQLGPFDWLGSSATAMLAIIILSIWQGVGFQMIILLAGLQSVPADRYEAARIDRANAWQQFRHITVPGIRNTLIFVVMVTTIFSFRLFDQVYILTQGGPQDSTTTVMYQAVTSAFAENNVGRGAAVTVIFFIIVLLITLLQRRVLKEEREIA
jgi:multiple sugar transport system permease protein